MGKGESDGIAAAAIAEDVLIAACDRLAAIIETARSIAATTEELLREKDLSWSAGPREQRSVALAYRLMLAGRQQFSALRSIVAVRELPEAI